MEEEALPRGCSDLREWKTRNLAEELSRQKVQKRKGPELVAILAYSCNAESQGIWSKGRGDDGCRKEGHLETPSHWKETALGREKVLLAGSEGRSGLISTGHSRQALGGFQAHSEACSLPAFPHARWVLPS